MAALMVWKDDYSVGNALLDGQHKRLIELVNDVDSDADLGAVLDGLRDYGEVHFKAEGDVMLNAFAPDRWHEVSRERFEAEGDDSADFSLVVLERQ